MGTTLGAFSFAPKNGSNAQMLHSVLASKTVSVYGRGNSGYARYNQAGAALAAALGDVDFLAPFTKGDELNNELSAFKTWLKMVVVNLRHRNMVQGARCVTLLRAFKEDSRADALTSNWEAYEVHPSIIEEQLAGRSNQEKKVAGTLLAVVKSNTSLLKKDNSESNTRLIKLDMTRANQKHPAHFTSYKPGDHVQIIAKNPRNLVNLCAAHLGVQLASCFDLREVDRSSTRSTDRRSSIHRSSDGASFRTHHAKGDASMSLSNQEQVDNCLRAISKQLGHEGMPAIPVPCSFEKLLASVLDLTAHPTPSLLRALAQCSSVTEDDFDVLETLATDDQMFGDLMRDSYFRVVDIFTLAPSLSVAHVNNPSPRLDIVSILCTHGPQIKPRSYSIASSQAASPHEAAVLLSEVRFKAAATHEEHRGLCSGYLTALQPGTAILLSYNVCRDFRLPADPRTPLLMIAAGTGIAPFRSFMAHRVSQLSMQSNHQMATLLFGCRDEGSELLAGEATEALRLGALSNYVVAFSRSPNHERQYVQHRLAQSPELLTECLGLNGHIYICGDANMSASVQEVMCSILKDDRAIDNLRSQGRFHEDVFGATLNVGHTGFWEAPPSIKDLTAKVKSGLQEASTATAARRFIQGSVTISKVREACLEANAEELSDLAA